MSDTEKLLKEIEEAVREGDRGAVAVTMVREMQNQLWETEALVNVRTNALDDANQQLAEQRQFANELTEKARKDLETIAEQRGDIAEMLNEIGACQRDAGRTYCYTHVSTNCSQIAAWRAKYLGVKP